MGDLAAPSTTANIFQTQDGRWHGYLEAQSNSQHGLGIRACQVCQPFVARQPVVLQASHSEG